MATILTFSWESTDQIASPPSEVIFKDTQFDIYYNDAQIDFNDTQFV